MNTLYDEANALHQRLQDAAWEYSQRFAAIPYSVMKWEEAPVVIRLNRIIGKAWLRRERRRAAHNQNVKMHWVAVLRDMPDEAWARLPLTTVGSIVKMAGLVHD